jgi:hypothetical protein
MEWEKMLETEPRRKGEKAKRFIKCCEKSQCEFSRTVFFLAPYILIGPRVREILIREVHLSHRWDDLRQRVNIV